MFKASRRVTTSHHALGSVPNDRPATDLAAFESVRPRASRRSLLAGLAPVGLALAAAGSAGAAPALSPDAELIAHCAAFDALERRIDALFDAASSGLSFEAADAASCVIEVDQRRLLDRICALPPATSEGCKAVARSLALLAPDYADPTHYAAGTMDERLAATLLRGMMGRADA